MEKYRYNFIDNKKNNKRIQPKSVIRTLECGFSLLFDGFCVFSASFVLLLVSIARYASRKEKRNLIENPSKIITNPNDRIGFK